MRHTAAILLLVVMACGQQQKSASSQQPARTAAQTSVATPNLTPEQLGELGAQIRKEPSRADEFLAQHGLTKESFEKAIREVTESTEASKRYAEAYRRASA